MKNTKLLDELTALSNGRFDFLKLSKIELDLPGRTCGVVFLYPERVTDFDVAAQNEAAEFAKKILGGSFKYDVKFKRSHIDAELLAADVSGFMRLNPLIAAKMPSAAVELKQDGAVRIALTFEDAVYTYAREAELDKKLSDYLDTAYCADFFIEIKKSEPVDVKKEFDADETAKETPENEDNNNQTPDNTILNPQFTPTSDPHSAFRTPHSSADPIQYTPVSDMNPFIGGMIEDKPRFIKDLTFERTWTTAAGRIADLRASDIKKDPPGRHAFNITLRDHTGSIKVLYFSTLDTDKKMQTIKIGDTLIVSGAVEKEEYGGRISYTLKARKLGFCELLPPPEGKVYKASYPEKYRTVFPKKYIDFTQGDFFTFMDEPCPYLKGKDFVVFDTETTGLTATDKIIELSAYKISGGRIVEEFDTLVNPEMPIPAESTKINGITDETVIGAPKIHEVIGDFYKFTENSILVAHNAAFDVGFIDRAGEKFNYIFDNEQLDTVQLARRYVAGLRKFSLDAVCKAMEIENLRAHRSASDALATAEVFLKIAPKIA